MDKAWWRRTSWQRVGFTILLTLVGLEVLALAVGHVQMWNMARETSDPRRSLVPQTITDKSLADIQGGITISRFGYSVQVPWGRVKDTQEWKVGTLVVFEDSSRILIENPANYVDVIGSASDSRAMRSALRPLLGEEAVRSHYDHLRVELQTRPSDASLFSRSNQRVFLLLNTKFMEIPAGTTAIYNVSTSGLRGFQFGDPAMTPTVIKLLLFDEQDRALRITFRGPTVSRQPALTQEQINAIVASIRPTN